MFERVFLPDGEVMQSRRGFMMTLTALTDKTNGRAALRVQPQYTMQKWNVPEREVGIGELVCVG